MFHHVLRFGCSGSCWKAASTLPYASQVGLQNCVGGSLAAIAHGSEHPTSETQAFYSNGLHEEFGMGCTAGRLPWRSATQLTQQNTLHHRLLCSGPRLKDDLLTPANMVSMARAFSAPVVAHFILQEQWTPALGLLAVAGASDWLDGYLARLRNENSVLGSYLDPFADKVLISCVVGALMYKSLFPVWLGALVVGRDTLLVGVSFYMRFQQLGWRWPGGEAFFKSRPGGTGGVPTATRVEPLMVSKVNTVLQLLTVAACLTNPAVGVPGPEAISTLAVLTGATTAWSGVAYGRIFWQRMK